MEEQKQEEFSLKQNCKNRVKMLFDQMRRDNKQVMSYLLIVDEISIKMISSYMKRMELMELDILAIEQLEHERAPYQKQHTIYFITPTEKSVDLLLEDFPNKKKYQYGFAHIYFTNLISPALMKKISQNVFLMERLKTFKEFNQDFMCKFDNIFNFHLNAALPTLYSDNGTGYHGMVQSVGSKLATVVTSLEKFYGVEIIYNKDSKKLSEQIALVVNDRLKEVIQGLQNNDPQEILDKESGKVTLLILDRGYDPITPLVRDFHYQPMLYDLKNIENDLVKYEAESEKGELTEQRAILSDQQDNLFPRYQFKHIAEVMEGIPEEFQEFARNNTTAQIQKGELNNLDFNTMSEVIKKMPKYRSLLAKYTMHIKLIQDCWQQFEDKDLSDIGELEQTLATGLDQNGKDMQAKKLISKISSILLSNKLNEQDKQRLVLLTIMCCDIVEKDRQNLTNKISFEGQNAVLNLKYFGISAQSSKKKSSKSKGKLDKKLKKNIINKMQSQTLSLCRHTPAIEQIIKDIMDQNSLDDCIDNGLPIGKFSSMKINLEERMGRSFVKNRNKKRKLKNIISGGQEDNENMSNQVPKFIIFIAGGISYSEIRALRNLKDQTNQNFGLIIGGSSIMTPNEYLDGLTKMKNDIN